MSEVAKLQKRIDHLIVTIGKRPTVLDIDPSNWDAVVAELRSDARYRGCIQPNYATMNFGITPTIDDEAEPKVLEIFGVRFCKGRA